MSYDGVLPVYKPEGFTSHDVVAKMRRVLGMKRIGHTGTLDPQVTGVLPLCLGRATRLVEYIQELPKAYEAELTLGYRTDTEDWTGETVERVEPGSFRVSAEAMQAVLAKLVGPIEQIPPMYSAVKVGGKKLYELARQGKEVERKPRLVHIYELELLKSMEPEGPAGYPGFRIRVLCSKGTYIRTLCVDIGQALGVPAVMSGLVRTSTGAVTLERCLTLEQIERLHRDGALEEALIPSDRAIAHFPAFAIPFREAEQAVQGKVIPRAAASPLSPSESGEETAEPNGRLARVYNPDGLFIGLFRLGPDSLRAEKVFAQPVTATE